MNLPQLSIKEYVFAFMINAVLVLFGIIGYQRIGVDRFPHIEFPVVSVTTTLPGANPDIVDSSITNIIESSVNSIPGIDFVQSTSTPGVSVVALQFELDKDIDVAFNEVQAKVNQVLRDLPEESDPPVVAKVEVGASPVMWLALRGDRTLQQLNQYARNVIKKRLETVDGVGEIRLGGERKRTIRVELDLDKMAGLSITAEDVRTAFREEHVQLPGGFLVAGATENLIKLDLEFHEPRALEEMIVRYVDGAPVRIGDIGQVIDGLADFRQTSRFDGEPSVGIGIVKVSNANTIAVIEEVQRRLAAEIRPQLPPGLTIEIAANDAELIYEIVSALKDHLIEGTLLAALVVLFFLRSVRSTLIIATAIPVSLLGAVALMYFSGFTFNTMTLLALLLLIGVVVDDAIVVLENIYRHREEIDPDPVSAAIKGTDQVVFAVMAASLTLVSIFGAVIFLGGIMGRFFQSFAVVVTAGVLVSLLVSLTLTPMLCSRYLDVAKRHGRIHQTLTRWLDGLDRGYRRVLGAALQRRWQVLGLTLMVVISSAYFFGAIGKTFIPAEDEGTFLVNFRTPLGSSIEATDAGLRQIENVLSSHPEITTMFTAIGLNATGQANQGIAFVRMVPRDERDMGQEEFLQLIRQQLAAIPGIKAFASRRSPVGGQRGEQLQFAVTGPELSEVARLSRLLFERLNKIDGIGRLDMDLELNLPQVRLKVDRLAAADMGLSASDVAFAVNMLAGGLDVAKFNDEPGDGERYDIRVKAAPSQLAVPADLRKIFLRNETGELVRLDALAEIEETVGPAVISRYDLRYAANFFGSPTLPLAAATALINQQAAEFFPLGYSISLKGQARELDKTAGYIGFAFTLAMVLVYMVLASQFNSFVQPLIVMTAQPLAIVGGLFLLWLTGHTLNMYSMIGMVLLIGLVAKNSILLVDLTNQLRGQGRGVDDALREACPIRLRPVLMTSATVILALTPAALGLGAGAATNGPLAVAVIGGMFSSTLLTLVVVPAVYSLVEGSLAARAHKSAGKHPVVA
ncbi:MAG TPA: efflux RND transporter permease subunit [Xanthomonadales bacterium]|nr:efflux RND transporter permease subunit [Xanthomonadales bacterium]